MIGLDTNVLVRYLAQDDPKQARLAARLVESLSPADPGFVSQVVLAETVWVLESCYAVDAAKVEEILDALLRADSIRVERAEVVWRALRGYKASHGDFSDTLIAAVASAAGCRTTYSFDRTAVKRAGMTLLE